LDGDYSFETFHKKNKQ